MVVFREIFSQIVLPPRGSYVIFSQFFWEADPRGFWLLREICSDNLDFLRGFVAHFRDDFLSFYGKGYLPVFEGFLRTLTL